MKGFFLFFLVFNLLAEDKLKILDLEFLKDIKKIKILFAGKIASEPILSFRKNMVQVEIPNAQVWPKIEKTFSLLPQKDITLTAYQFNETTVRFRAVFPDDIEQKADGFLLKKELDFFTLELPVLDSRTTQDLDERYLAKMLIEKGEVVAPEKKVEKKERREEFSFAPFIGKFAGFLIFVLLIFFSIVFIFKKIMQKKGRSGFLNGMNSVEVLSSTYVGPKKNILLVKVYKQVLLLGVSENGVNFLTEINSPIDLLKQGEENLTGTNFDKSLTKADMGERKFPLKEDVQEASLEKKERITDQIKKKIQQLKPLQ